MLLQFDIKTNSRIEMIDITDRVSEHIRKSKISDGLCLVYVPHTTAGITINEGADIDVQRDIIAELNKVIPFSDGYHHSEGNSAAHIKSSIIGASISLIINKGKLILGTWQAVYFCEFDGPRNRKVYIKII